MTLTRSSRRKVGARATNNKVENSRFSSSKSPDKSGLAPIRKSIRKRLVKRPYSPPPNKCVSKNDASSSTSNHKVEKRTVVKKPVTKLTKKKTEEKPSTTRKAKDAIPQEQKSKGKRVQQEIKKVKEKNLKVAPTKPIVVPEKSRSVKKRRNESVQDKKGEEEGETEVEGVRESGPGAKSSTENVQIVDKSKSSTTVTVVSWREKTAEVEVASTGPLNKSVLPKPTDPLSVQRDKMIRLRDALRKVIGEVINQVQKVEEIEIVVGDQGDRKRIGSAMMPYYKSVERIYGYFAEAYGGTDKRQGRIGGGGGNNEVQSGSLNAVLADLGRRYRNLVITVLWGFGAIVWRMGGSSNVFVERVKGFLVECLRRLGWVGGGISKRKRRRRFLMMEWKEESYRPACYFVCSLFVKYHSDTNTYIRQNQLGVMYTLVETAAASDNDEFLSHVLEYCKDALLIRMKDRSSVCRAKAMSVLCALLRVHGAEEKVMKELKYYTRYDPSAEVRRIGTRELSRVGRLKLRFFFDQAFDKDFGVRLEAFKAMGLETEEEEPKFEQNEDEDDMRDSEEGQGTVDLESEEIKKTKLRLLRDMDQLSKERLCKLVMWGAFYSDAKCGSFVRNVLLKKWLTVSCRGDLVRFIGHLDPFDNLRTVNRILDLMFKTGEGEGVRLVEEGVDLDFVGMLKQDIMEKRWKNVSVEGMVGWLGLCKASEERYEDGDDAKRRGFLRSKVVPRGDEMGELLRALHDCVFLEHQEAEKEGRAEDAGPIFCVVLGLEICRFVAWEEAGRRHMKRQIQSILLDPIMDERMLVVQSMNVLHRDFTDAQEFEDVMMEVFQDVFDPASEYNRRWTGDNSTKEERSSDDFNMDDVYDEQEKEPVVPQLTRLREKLCDLAMTRFNLTREKEALLKNNQDTAVISEKLKNIIEEQTDIQQLLKDQEKEMDMRKLKLLEIASRSSMVSEEDSRPNTRMSDIGGDDESMTSRRGSGEETNLTGVISTVEEGLSKGLFMINGYMDLKPGMSPFIRNLYDNYVLQFMTEKDSSIRVSVIQLITRVAMIEKRELRRVTNIVIRCLISSDVEADLITVGFKCLVDLLLVYEWSDFMLSEEEIEEGAGEGDFKVSHPYFNDYTTYLQMILDDPRVTFRNCSLDQMRRLFIDLLTKKFPPSKSAEIVASGAYGKMMTVKNQGLLKLLVRGKLRDPRIVADVLGLWVNNDYSGTSVLRDLECVLKLYGTFEWWKVGASVEFNVSSIVEEEEGEYMDDSTNDGEDNVEETRRRDEAMRVLGIAVAEAVIRLCQEVTRKGGGGVGGGMGGSGGGLGGGDGGVGWSDKEDSIGVVVKFISYFLGFLDRKDQPLMRTMACTILHPVVEYPTRSHNNLLVRCASRIPITNFKSARLVVRAIGSIFHGMRNHPSTNSVLNTLKELTFFFKKLKRVFGDNIGEGLEGILEWERGAKRRGDDWADEFTEDEDDEDIERREPACGGGDVRFTSSSSSEDDDDGGGE